jgi:GTPase SAR1 family protein
MAALELSPNLRVRVNLIGDPHQGKTSFVRALVGEPLPTETQRTVGVEIRHLSNVDRGAARPRCAFTLFDFGGHVEYYSLQCSLLSDDCVHVVVVNLAEVVAEATQARALGGVTAWLDGLSASGVTGVVSLLGTHLDRVKW